MTPVFLILAFQVLAGGIDNLWHHELTVRLPQRVSARRELALHAAREAIYAVVFFGLAWWAWHGVFAGVLAGLLLLELFVTMADFLDEDRTRRLPPFERLLHTVLTLGHGVLIGALAPVLIGWSSLPSGLVFTPHGWVSWAFTACAGGVLAWSVRNALAAQRLHGAAACATQCGAPMSGSCRTHIAPAVLVTGATGFVGRALVASLRRDGRRVVALSRDARLARGLFGRRVWVVESLDDIPSETRIEAIVNLAGARVLGVPWTASRRRALQDSRVETTAAVVDLMRRLHQAPKVLVSASAVGYYGASPAASFEPLGEGSPPRPGQFQSDLCVAIEHEARRAEALGVRVVRMRLGVVLGRDDGAWPMLAFSARLGLGAVLGSGRQPAPWIHLDDAVGLIRFAISRSDVAGPVNAVAPVTPSQATFARSLAASFGRRVRLRLPDALMRAALGEMSTLLLDGQNAVPGVALAAGYVFCHPRLDGALRDLARVQPMGRPVRAAGT